MKLLLSIPHLSTTLRHLSVSEFSHFLDAECIDKIPNLLPKLELLKVPCGFVTDSFFNIISDMTTPWPLKTLEPCSCIMRPERGFSSESLRRALHKGLPKLRSLGFGSHAYALEDKEIDAILRERAEIEGIPRNSNIRVGIYFLYA